MIDLATLPDAHGHFGPYGGMFVPETLMTALNELTEDKARDIKVIITEKHQLPSQMPFSYAGRIRGAALALPEGMRPGEADLITWQFYGGSTVQDAKLRTRDNIVFFFCMDPNKFLPMMDGVDELTSDQVAQIKGYVAEMVAAFPEVRLMQLSGEVNVGALTTSDA